MPVCVISLPYQQVYLKTAILLSARDWHIKTALLTRRLVIENALRTILLEVHGGKEYLEVGLKMARQALLNGRSLLIFQRAHIPVMLKLPKAERAHREFYLEQA